MTSIVFTPSKGGDPDNKTYNTTPHDHISAFSSCYLPITSGAI